ncbi:hypothetical protein HJG54_19675 [Leptolyngbya sp. NK1-12]|uniref:Uncharacterized protein n=1 Tax=Leptolyngbya sp. NK1-12 TaxID=2547451 RepID=A0AA96WG93_9CYAN|nr:hypothetical protein [Leptolyngbya sp. NK1-12]WNZ24848.1 hypothetical protein HJG54_19675 [Leptolyngbya sp. NK1-12]
MLILPGDPEFETTLATALPPDWIAVAERMGQQCCFVADRDSGLLRPATDAELTEYLYGGEYDERLEAIEALEETDELVTVS